MPNQAHIPTFEELPPISPDRNFFYCPDPLLLTDEQLAANFPREIWHELFVSSGIPCRSALAHTSTPEYTNSTSELRPNSEMQSQ